MGAGTQIDANSISRTSCGIVIFARIVYRGKLWNYGKSAPEVMGELVKFVDIGIANEEDFQKSLSVKRVFRQLSNAEAAEVIAEFISSTLHGQIYEEMRWRAKLLPSLLSSRIAAGVSPSET
jgi:hypothetical protein